MLVDHPISKPFAIDELARAAIIKSCTDCDLIPKHPLIGMVDVDSDGKKWQRMLNGLFVEYGGYHGEWMASIIAALRGHHEPQEGTGILGHTEMR